ncbi:hypothetical protein K439DRAFT_1293873, partial [Ramaria rubella]
PYDQNADYLRKVQEQADNYSTFCGLVEDGQVTETLPRDIPDAVSGRDAEMWKPFIERDLNGFLDNDVYDVMPIPTEVKPILSRTIFKIKRDQHGNISD